MDEQVEPAGDEALVPAVAPPPKRGETARQQIHKAKAVSRRQFSAEEKIRIVMEGIRGDQSIAELCRRERVHPTVYYKWLKDFMEAGKRRLKGDMQREAGASASRRAGQSWPPMAGHSRMPTDIHGTGQRS